MSLLSFLHRDLDFFCIGPKPFESVYSKPPGPRSRSRRVRPKSSSYFLPQQWALSVSLKIEPSDFFSPCLLSFRMTKKNAVWDWKPQRLSYTSFLHNLRLCGLAARTEVLTLFCFGLVNFCKNKANKRHHVHFSVNKRPHARHCEKIQLSRS